MNVDAASRWSRAGALLQYAGWFVWLSWFALAPVFAQWVHTTERSLAVPIAILGGSVGLLVGARACLPRPQRTRLVDAGDLPLFVLVALWLGSAALADAAPAQRNAVQVTAVLAMAFGFGKLAAGLPSPDRPLRHVVLPIAVAIAVFATAEVAIGANWFYERIPGNPYYVPYRDLGRPVATQFNPAPLATFLLATFALAIAGLGSVRRRLAIVLAVVLVVVLALVRSRAAFIGFGVAVVVALTAGRAVQGSVRRRVVAVGVVALAVVALSSVLPPPFDQFGVWRIAGTGGLLAQDRQIRLDAALAMWRDRPWLGVGFDQFPRWFGSYVADPRLAPLASTPDNGWIALLAENGLAGLAAFLTFAVAPIVRAVRALRRVPDDELLRSCAAGLAALLVNLVGYTLLFWTTPCALLGLLCGLTAGRTTAVATPGSPTNSGTH